MGIYTCHYWTFVIRVLCMFARNVSTLLSQMSLLQFLLSWGRFGYINLCKRFKEWLFWILDPWTPMQHNHGLFAISNWMRSQHYKKPKYNESCVISVAPGYEFSCRAAGRRTWSQSLAPAMGPFLCEVKVLILESHCFEKEVFEATRIVGGGFLHSSYNRIQEIGSRNYLN